MATNDFLPFATGGSANVLTQAQWAALGALLNGFQSGIADSKSINKAFRQSSIMSAVLAQFIVNQTGQNATDDGTTATLLANLTAATAGRLLRTTVYTINGGTQQVSVNGAAFTSTGATTWSPLSSTGKARIRLWGAGGGGGGSTSSVAGGSGAGAGYAEGIYYGVVSPQSVAVGLGGAAGAANSTGAGAAGGSSSVGSLISATGGGGSLSATAGIGSGGYMNVKGTPGQGSVSSTLGGSGGSSFSTSGGLSHTSSVADPGMTPGAGGAGGGSAFAGGKGGDGFVLIEEFA